MNLKIALTLTSGVAALLMTSTPARAVPTGSATTDAANGQVADKPTATTTTKAGRAAARREARAERRRLKAIKDAAAKGTDTATYRGPEGNDIIVTGIRGSVTSARNTKRNSKQIVDSVYAEDAGKLPDNNVVEALARITGVQIDRADGEGSDVTIRGIDDVQTTLNGNNTNLGGYRSLSLSDVPAELLKSVKVYKTRTADQVEGGMGGTVDVELRRPLDLKKGLTVAGSVRGSYDGDAKKVSPFGSLLLSDRFDTGIGEIGLLANLSYTNLFYSETYVQSETPQPLGQVGLCCTTDTGAIVPGSLLDNATNRNLLNAVVPYRSFVGTERGNTKRPSVNLTAQWKPNDHLNFVIEGAYFGSQQTQQRDRLFLFLRDSGITDISNLQYQPDGVTARSFSVFSPDGIPGGVDSLAIKSADDLYTTNAEMHWTSDRAQLDVTAQYNWSKSTYQFVEQVLSFADQNSADIDFASSQLDGRAPFFSFPGFDLSNVAGYRFGRFHDEAGGSSNKEFASQADLTLKLSDNSFLRTLQTGVRFNRRNASRYYGYRDGYPLIDGELPLLSDFPGGDRAQLVQPGIANAPAWYEIPGPVLFREFSAARAYVQANDPGDAAAFATATPPSDNGSTFSTTENTVAVYGQINYALKLGFPIDGVAGIRVVNTFGNVSSTRYQAALTDADGFVVSQTNATAKGNYVDYLPSVNAIVHFTPKLQLRLAYTFNVSRPSFDSLRPFAYIDTTQSPVVVSAGNPNLVAQTETNYDASLEYYFGRAGQISFGGFIKKPKNYLFFSSAVEDLAPYGLTGTGIVNQERNAGDGEFRGIEAAAQSFFDFLPGFARNFGANVNFTWIPTFRINFPFDADTAAIPGVFDAPGTSKYTGNAVFYYDTPVFSARIAYNYRSRRREYVLTQNPGYSPYTEATSRLDAAVNVTPYKFLTLSLEAANLLKNNTYEVFGEQSYLPLGVRLQARTVQASARFRF